MVQIPWHVIRDPASNLPETPRAVIDAARNAACNLYRDYPNWLTGDYGAIATPNPVRWLWDFICDDPRDAPPPPLPPFSGGQCCELYNVRVVGTVEGSPVDNTFSGLSGKIKGLKWIPGEGQPDRISGAWYIESGVDCPNAVPELTASHGGGNMQSMPTASIASIVKADGSADVCGDPPPNWPVVFPPPERLNFPITINIDGINVEVPVSIPFTNINNDINIKPEFNINLGDINVNFNLDGINVSFPIDINLPQIPVGNDPRPPGSQPPPVNQPGGGGGGTGGNCPDVNLEPVLRAIEVVRTEVDELEEMVEELLDCDRCARLPVGAPGLGVIRYPAAQSGNYELPDKTEWVTIDFVEIPENYKGQWGQNAPSVYYAGWFSLGSGANAGIRTPIQYQNMSVPVEKGMTNFTYTMPIGYTAEITIWSRTED